MKELIKKIENWADERNLIKGSTPQKQFIKLMEEFGELCAGVLKNKEELIIDSIGDCFVVAVIMCKQLKIGNYVLEKGYIDADESTEKDVFICTRLAGVLGDIAKITMYKKKEIHGDFRQEFYELAYFLSKMSLNNNTWLDTCGYTAWNEIKDRKGRMIKGVFVKEADL